MKTKPIPAALLGVALIVLGGCETLEPQSADAASVGWVTATLGAAELKRLGSACADSAELATFSGDQFARVREPHGRRTFTVYAHVPRGMQVQAGDEVVIQPSRCGKGAMPEVRRVIVP